MGVRILQNLIQNKIIFRYQNTYCNHFYDEYNYQNNSLWNQFGTKVSCDICYI